MSNKTQNLNQNSRSNKNQKRSSKKEPFSLMTVKTLLAVLLFTGMGVIIIGGGYIIVRYTIISPNKIDMSITNPVIETQCEIDSDCKLAYTGSNICLPCDTSIEEYKCLSLEETKKIEEKRFKRMVDDNIFCERCLEKPQHICVCSNGKCEKVKEGLIEEVTVATDKMEYEQGENINFTLYNNYNRSIWYVPGTPHCNTVPCDTIPHKIYKYFNSSWEEAYCWGRTCSEDTIGSPFYKELSANNSTSFYWKQDLYDYYTGTSNIEAGKYKILMIYRENSTEDSLDNEVYSNEFTIKEKAALDPRCSEKVIGMGQKMPDGAVTSCPRVWSGYEFDLNSKKCVEKRVGGCSVQSPFETLEECQEVCEKAEPRDKKSCEAAGGKWEINDVEVCNLPTSDFGKECSDSNQCEGLCIAELSEEEYNKATQGTIIYTKGKCSGETNVLGCTPIVNDGKVNGILCMD